MNLNTLPVPDAMYSTAPTTIVPCTVHVHISLHGNIGKVHDAWYVVGTNDDKGKDCTLSTKIKSES